MGLAEQKSLARCKTLAKWDGAKVLHGARHLPLDTLLSRTTKSCTVQDLFFVRSEAGPEQ